MLVLKSRIIMRRKNTLINENASIFHPPTLVHEYVVETKQSIKQDQEENHELSIFDIAFRKHNKEFPDGRVFGGYDEGGRYYAVTVSPYFDQFESQIESGIRGVVNALKGKGYLTCSSCYGHPKRAMVTICFPSEKTRDDLASILLGGKIPTLDLTYRSTMVNVGVNLDKMGRVKFTKNLEFDHSFESHRKMEIDSFNETFFRSYNEYYFLQITLVDDYHPYINPIKFLKTRKYLLEKDKLLLRLENLILSDKVPMFLQ